MSIERFQGLQGTEYTVAWVPDPVGHRRALVHQLALGV